MRPFPKLQDRAFTALLGRLSTPSKIQDYLNRLRFNHERQGETCRSPREVMRHKRAHCMEGAMVAAAAFWYHGAQPLLMDLKTTDDDMDHVLALFRDGDRWGAVSKTNHAVLRYRDPVYRDPRELAMSYFNEYFLDNGKKTLRSFSAPFDLSRYGGAWLTAREDLWNIPQALDRSRHSNILPAGAAKKLRLADKVEIQAGRIVEWRS